MSARPTLYWISGSPPAWRVMLTLALKDIEFASHRLDHSKGENKTAHYLSLNPKGQVPTLKRGPVIIRESIAILAWLDREYPERPIFGEDAASYGRIWQDVIEWESELRPAVASIAQILLRDKIEDRKSELRSAIENVEVWLNQINSMLDDRMFLGGHKPMANDIWLLPSLEWISRAADKAGNRSPLSIQGLLQSRPALSNWRSRMNALPQTKQTFPPHWIKQTPSTKLSSKESVS